jgi:hypothetical protein
MNEPDPSDPTTLSWPSALPAIATALLMVVIGCATTLLVLRFDALRPQLGDMIVFIPSAPDPDAGRLTVPISTLTGDERTSGHCVLDIDEMSTEGGSLIIESRRVAGSPVFQVHWAGHHTAKGPGDCGPSADFTVDRTDLRRLATAAGGFGVRPPFAPEEVTTRSGLP